jgi:hypothetical protein
VRYWREFNERHAHCIGDLPVSSFVMVGVHGISRFGVEVISAVTTWDEMALNEKNDRGIYVSEVMEQWALSIR